MSRKVDISFETNPLAMLVFRRDNFQIVDANAAAASMYGYSRDQLLRMTTRELTAERNIPYVLQYLIGDKSNTGSRDLGIKEHLTAAGNRLYVNVFSQSYREEDKTRLLMLQDVSSTVTNNQQNLLFAQVARTSSNGIAITGSGGKIQWVNESWTHMTGYTMEEAWAEKPGDLLQGPETDRETVDYIYRQLEKDEGCRTQILNYRKDGSSFWNDMEIQPVHDDEGNLIQWVEVKQDISARQKAQEEAKASESLFYRALRLSPIPVMLREEDGTISFINEAFVRTFGYKLEDIPDVEQWARVVYPHSVNDGLQAMRAVFEKGESYHDEDMMFQTKDGKRRIYEFWDIPLGHMSGRNSKTAISMAVDITQLRDTQQQLEHELTKFRQLFDHAPNALAMSDPNGTILEVNAEFERFFGYDKQEVAGQDIDRLLTSNDAEFEEAQKKTQQLNQQQSFWEETTRYTKNGSQVPVYQGGVAVRIEGQVQYLYHIYSDISQIKSLLQENQRLLKQEQSLRAKAEASRAQFEDMFEESPAGIALLEGPEHTFSYTNPAYRQIIGKDKFEGWRIIDALPEIKEQGLLDLLDHVYRSGEVYSSSERLVKIVQDNGSERNLYLKFTYKPLTDLQGETYGIMVHVVDITNQVEFRQQIEWQLEEKSTLLDEIHHRVKNNLAVITSLLYLQMEETDSALVQEKLNEAQNRIHSIALVHQQLYQQAESDANIDMDAYLASLLRWLEQSSEPSGKTIAMQSEANNIAVPLAQAVPLSLIVTEIVTNAYKHGFEGREEGSIQLRLTDDDDYYYLRISDNGTGLPEDFSIEDGSTGMQIIQSLVMQLHAELTYDSSLAAGTTFDLKIPKTS